MRMLDPPRLDTELQAVVDAARGGDEPSELARARVRKSLDLKLAAGIALAAAPASSAFAAALKMTAAVVAVGSVVTAGVYAIPRYLSSPAATHASAPHVAVRAAPVVVARPAEVAVSEAVVAPPPRPRVRHRAAVPAPAPAPVDNASGLDASGLDASRLDASGLKEETVMLGAANAALGHGDVTRALSLLDDYDRRPGAGLLAEERTVTGILASCAAGHLDAARAAARHFQVRWPRSPLAARVDRSCVGPGGQARPGH